MLDYIHGKVVGTADNQVVLEVGGIGFKLHVPLSVSRVLSPGSIEKLSTVVSLKNEEIKLYGFATNDERRMFEKLQSVSGIGPAMALNILSASTLSSLYQAIITEDLSLFKKIKGVGQKTAQRIVLELKGSLSKEKVPVTIDDNRNVSLQNDAIAALLSLGYSHEESGQAVTNAWKKMGKNASIDNLIREALASLA